MAETSDPYATIAEYYDLMAVERWRQLGPAVLAALDGVAPTAGPLLDLGAGTGLVTAAIADAVPGAVIVAVEPSPAMRAVLLSRLVAREDLRRRVTVLPVAFAAAELPPRLCGAVALGMLGHLDPADRAARWRTLAARLAPGAPAIVEIQPPAQPEPVPMARFTHIAVGDHDYEGWAQAEPARPAPPALDDDLPHPAQRAANRRAGRRERLPDARRQGDGDGGTSGGLDPRARQRWAADPARADAVRRGGDRRGR